MREFLDILKKYGVAALLAAIGLYLVTTFGPVLLAHWLEQPASNEEKQLLAENSRRLGEANEAVRNLEAALRDLKTQPVPPPAAVPIPEAPKPPEPSPPSVAAPAPEVPQPPEPSPPPAPENRPAPDMAAAEIDPVQPSGDIVFGVFEDQEFSLCGYSGFKARIVRSRPTGEGISIKSQDRSIPDRSFRGFETTLPLGVAKKLWNCSVAAGYTEHLGIRRIVVSVSSGG